MKNSTTGYLCRCSVLLVAGGISLAINNIFTSEIVETEILINNFSLTDILASKCSSQFNYVYIGVL